MIAPKLRFREFTDEWRAKKLGDFAKTFSGGTPSSSNKSFYVGEIPFIKSGEISTNKTAQAINEEALKTSSAKMVQRGDILYALYGATSGQVAISQINGAINQAVLCIRPEANNYFIYSVLESKKSVILSTYLQGGQGNLSANIIKNLEIKLPSLAEQEKIAKFLAAMDARIDAGARKLELLRDYKTAISLKIFSHQTRFPGFSDEWISRKLGEIADFINGYTFLSSTYDDEGKYKIITIANVQGGKMDLAKVNKIREIPENIQPAQILAKNDILISMTGNVGRVCRVDAENCLLNQRVGKIISKNSANEDFIYHAIANPKFLNEMINHAQGGAQGNLSMKDIMNYEILLPTLPEQKKIASFLSALDDKISQNSRKLSALREFKKALFQKIIT